MDAPTLSELNNAIHMHMNQHSPIKIYINFQQHPSRTQISINSMAKTEIISKLSTAQLIKFCSYPQPIN